MFDGRPLTRMRSVISSNMPAEIQGRVDFDASANDQDSYELTTDGFLVFQI